MNCYGTLRLLETSPVQSFAEPLTVAELRQFLAIPTLAETSPVTVDPVDDEIALLITAAREQAEGRFGRDLVPKQYEMALDYWLGYEIPLRAPLVSVDSVMYTDSDGNVTTMAEGTDYVVDTVKHPGLIMPPYNKTWPTFTPSPSSAIRVQFTSGYAAGAAFWSDSGARLKAGMKLLIGEWFENRLPLSYDIASGGQKSTVLDRIDALLSAGSLTRFA